MEIVGHLAVNNCENQRFLVNEVLMPQANKDF